VEWRRRGIYEYITHPLKAGDVSYNSLKVEAQARASQTHPSPRERVCILPNSMGGGMYLTKLYGRGVWGRLRLH